MNVTRDRRISIAKIVFLLVALAVYIKLIFTGFSADEEYSLVLAYRIAKGDRLFGEVWDTIQTSGLLPALLLKPFVFLTNGTTGSMVYLRVCGLIIQILVSLYLYSVLKKHIGCNKAFFVTVIFAVSFVKMMAMPDFSNQQTWSLTLLYCFVWEAFENEENQKKCFVYMILSGIAYSCSVLATADIILFPVILVFILVLAKKNKGKYVLTFTGTCFFLGALFILCVSSKVGFRNMLANAGNVLSGDSTHLQGMNLLGKSKALSNAKDLLTLTIWILASIAVSLGISCLRKKKEEGVVKQALVIASWIGAGYSLVEWLIVGAGYDTMKLYIPIMTLIGVFIFVKNRSQKEFLFQLFGTCLGFFSFLNVMLISNVTIYNNIAFLFPAVISGAVALCLDDTEERFIWSYPTVVVYALVTLVGTGFTFLSGNAGNNVFSISGIVKNGPVAGLLTTKDIAYVYYNDYNAFSGLVDDGEKVLIVTDFFKNMSVTSCYMLDNVEISHYSVNSTPTYSDKLLEYWELFPEKKPNVLMVNTTSVALNENDWIYDYIQKNFSEENTVTTDIAKYYFR